MDKEWRPKLIEQYLKRYYKNVDTRTTYRAYLKLFFKTIEIEPDDFIQLDKKTIENHIWKYIQTIEDKPKKTQSIALTTLKMFLERHDIEMKRRIWEDMKGRNNLKKNLSALVKKKTPTQMDLRKILSHANIQGKALFILCASSGLRIDEALNLTFKDIDMRQQMIDVNEDVAKGGLPRVAFFSDEAKEQLELWFIEREKMLQRRYQKSKYVRQQLERKGYTMKRCFEMAKGRKIHRWEVYKDDKKISKDELLQMEKRIFPFHYINAQQTWGRLLEKTGPPYNEKDGNPKLLRERYIYNIHSLRRYFFTQMSSDRANEEYVNAMGGHQSRLDRSYKLFYEDEALHKMMRDEYRQHMKSLSIYTIPADYQEINTELSNLKNENLEMKQRMQQMENEFKQKELMLEMISTRLEVEKLKNGKKS